VREAPIKVVARQPGAIRSFVIRVVTAIVQGTILIVADIWGGMFGWAAAVAIVAVMCVMEFYAMMRTGHRKPNELFGVVAVALMPFAAALYATKFLPAAGATSDSQMGAVGLTAVVGGLVLAALLWHTAFKQVTAADTASTVFGAIYCGFTLSHLVLLRALDSGAEIVIIMLAGTWCMDSLAYLVGSAVGSHAMAPHVSPKKSWEGFAAGTAGMMAAWGIGWWIVRPQALPLWLFFLIGAVAAVAGVLGDLAESRFKREVGSKDSGTLLPGHGGFLDRFDSMIMVTVVVYYLLLFGGAK
jgi:phosphatidate cytidylyltransferase